MLFAERGGGVVRSAKRSCMVSACLIFLFLVMILFERVDVVFVGVVICRAERSLPRYRWSSIVVCSVASRIFFDHWVSKGCVIGN